MLPWGRPILGTADPKLADADTERVASVRDGRKDPTNRADLRKRPSPAMTKNRVAPASNPRVHTQRGIERASGPSPIRRIAAGSHDSWMGRSQQHRLDLHDEKWNDSRTLDALIEELRGFAVYVDRERDDGWELNCAVKDGGGFLSRVGPAQQPPESHGGTCHKGGTTFLTKGPKSHEIRISELGEGADTMAEVSRRFRITADWLEKQAAASWVLVGPVSGDVATTRRPDPTVDMREEHPDLPYSPLHDNPQTDKSKPGYQAPSETFTDSHAGL
jgi:hypothetical protein